MKKKSSTLGALLILSTLLLSNCGDKKEAPQDTPEVGIMTLKEEPFVLTTVLPGRTRPYRVAEVRPQVSGIILKRQFVEGSDVKEGQSLYQIDPAPYQAAYDSAKGDLAKAEATAEINHLTVKRYKPLLGTNFVSHQDYDTAVANAKQADATVVAAKASLKTAHINLIYTKVISPISGRIGKSSVTEGALVTENQTTPLSTVQQLDPIYVDVTQSSRDFLRLRREYDQGFYKKSTKNIAVELILEDGTLYNQQGELEFSDVTVDETTGAITVRAIFPNPDHILLPGMFVRARLKEGTKEKAILAPQQGITRNPRGEATALVVDANNKVVLREVKAVQAVGDKWLVTSGLKAGDKIIVSGHMKVRPGMTVKFIEVKADEKT
ncbi:efflux RND transporter periplasmic adaptor subunit [Legionella hackeliae]|uniref:Acriflavine resistance protein A n=1 Tax=Legionella hackeliae TaxID=449 RepID=A0A0A8UVS8_LEGHA|nr:efflux RND transporter periplasmic adaptor subunit [Legionella hackeliae]KTD15448.1 efflux protein [Legionella hackeliae]CEK11182.1 Acriflavine resistance protein A [Legionella hackeliae]STX47948.1 efflux protein [Legionella hackeliae]